MKKVDSLSKIIAENYQKKITIIPERITQEADIEKVVLDFSPDIVIKACDPDLSFRVYLNRVCFKHFIPFIHLI